MPYMNEQALFIIASTLGQFPDLPYDDSWPEAEKAELTFSKWALGELLNLIWEHPFTPASETIETFVFKAQIYEAVSQIPDQKQIFSIAAKTAQELLTHIKEVEQ